MSVSIKTILKNPVLKNFSVLTISNVIVQALNIFSSIKIAKNLLPEGYGFYTFILSLSGIYYILSSLGFRNAIVRGIAVNKNEAKNYFAITFITRTFAFFIAVLAIIVYNIWFSKVVLSGWYVFWLCMNIFVTVHWDTLESITFGYEKMKYSAYINLFVTIVWVAMIVLLPASYIKVFLILVLTVIFQLIKTVIILIITYRMKMIAFGWMPAWSEILPKLKEAFPYYVLAVFTLFTSSLPVIYLEHLSTNTEIAYFNVAGRLISPLQLLLLTLLTSLFPALSRNFEYDKEKFSKTIKIAFAVIFGAGLLGALFVSTFRNEIVNFLYGDKYAESASVIAIQCWFTVLFGVFCLIGTILGAINKQVLVSKLSIVYAIISFPCLIYGARYGAVGLSIGFVIAGVLNMTYHLYFLQKSIPEKINYSYLYVSAVLFILLFAGSLVITKLSFIIRLAIAVLVFIILAARGYKYWQTQQKKGGIVAK